MEEHLTPSSHDFLFPPSSLSLSWGLEFNHCQNEGTFNSFKPWLSLFNPVDVFLCACMYGRARVCVCECVRAWLCVWVHESKCAVISHSIIMCVFGVSFLWMTDWHTGYLLGPCPLPRAVQMSESIIHADKISTFKSTFKAIIVPK